MTNQLAELKNAYSAMTELARRPLSPSETRTMLREYIAELEADIACLEAQNAGQALAAG
jgi:hypothetical protein